MKWTVEILWEGRWIVLANDYDSQNSAEWAIGQWKQKNQCFRDPFRVLQCGPNVIDHDADTVVRIEN